MHRRLFLTALTGGVLTAISPRAFAAASDELSQAQRLFHDGDIRRAARQAEDIGSPLALCLSAECLSSLVMLSRTDRPETDIEKAQTLARRAEKAAPELLEAHIQSALADGFAVRLMSPGEAWRSGAPRDLKRKIEGLLDTGGKDPRIHALWGAWHLGIYRRGGTMGRSYYGASLDEGLGAYETAVRMAPGHVIIATNYALTLLAMDKDIYAARAKQLLTTVSGQSVSHAVDIEVQSRAGKLLGVIDHPEELQRCINVYLDNLETGASQ